MDENYFDLDPGALFVIWIDQFDQITDWKSNSFFAAADPSASGEKSTYVGTNLFDYVIGHFTRTFLRKFLKAARETSEQKRTNYRCNSPSHKQLMEMRACLEPDGRIRISHSLVESEPLKFDINFATATKYQSGSVLRCSICNRLRHRGVNDWYEPEQLAEPNEMMLVIHTVCADCRNGIKVKSVLRASQP